jgi:large-conductance mechanosensitive channel
MADTDKTETHTVKIETEKGHHAPKVAVVVGNELTETTQGFLDFLREYAVAGLAIGFIIGQQANTVMKQMVDSFIGPWVQVLFGQSIATRYTVLHHGTTPIKMAWGKFVYDLIEFVFVLLFIYVFIKIFHLNSLAKKKKRKK